MAPTDLPLPGRGPVDRPVDRPVDTAGVGPVRLAVDLGRRYRLSVYSFGLACCAVEFVAAAHGDYAVPDDLAAADPAAIDVLVISGTLTDKMAPAVKRFYDRMPEPRYVVSFGACAACGGPYWDSYSVTKGVDQLIPVDVYVPGCPPRPEALLDGLRLLHEQISEQIQASA